MIVNYMLPVSTLIVLTTIYSLNGMRKISLEISKCEFTTAESLNALKSKAHGTELENKQTNSDVIAWRECKNCLKVTCMVQTAYDIVWFIAVIALENLNFSNVMPIIFSTTTCILVSSYTAASKFAFNVQTHGK